MPDFDEQTAENQQPDDDLETSYLGQTGVKENTRDNVDNKAQPTDKETMYPVDDQKPDSDDYDTNTGEKYGETDYQHQDRESIDDYKNQNEDLDNEGSDNDETV